MKLEIGKIYNRPLTIEERKRFSYLYPLTEWAPIDFIEKLFNLMFYLIIPFLWMHLNYNIFRFFGLLLSRNMLLIPAYIDEKKKISHGFGSTYQFSFKKIEWEVTEDTYSNFYTGNQILFCRPEYGKVDSSSFYRNCNFGEFGNRRNSSMGVWTESGAKGSGSNYRGLVKLPR